MERILHFLKNPVNEHIGLVEYDKLRIEEIIKKIEALENQDKLAELEKVILDYYLGKGYQIGIGGWSFKVAIQTKYKNKKLLVYFKESELDTWNYWLRIDNEQTTKEMFNKAIEWFKTN